MTQTYDTHSTAAGLLQLARMKAGLSQAKLAARAKVPATMISAYERDLRQPTLPTLIRLLEAAGFELRLNLEPLDDHDRILKELEAARTPQEKERLDQQQARWRQARLVEEQDGT